jgi:hypothetical protein
VSGSGHDVEERARNSTKVASLRQHPHGGVRGGGSSPSFEAAKITANSTRLAAGYRDLRCSMLLSP